MENTNDQHLLTMKRLLLIMIILLSVFLAVGQELKEKEIKFHKSKQVKETFEVLKSDKKIKHGIYISYFKGSDNSESIKHIHQKGNYNNGQKDGLWTIFKRPRMEKKKFIYGELDSVGNYKKGIKSGIWITSTKEDGQVKIRYDFDENKKVDPLINVNLEYPEIAAELGVQGIVKLSFKTNLDCSVSDVKVVSGLGHGCDKSAIKSVKKMANLSLKYRPNDSCDVSTKTIDFTFTLK